MFLLLGMVLISGASSLIYQLCWMKQLGFLFGNTAQATSVTLAAFFAGLGVGSWWWGKRSAVTQRPMRLYAILELGIALTALVYFPILIGFNAIYPSLHGLANGTGWLLTLKFGLALLLIFPPACFMGGTVPAIGQALIQDRNRFGRTGALIYGTNTLGAAIGVLSAAFLWIPTLGFGMTYGLAVILSLAVGVTAWKLSQSESADTSHTLIDADDDTPQTTQAPWKVKLPVVALCFISGFVILALEVAWMRIFAQVHDNSVYSFAIILAVVLVCLAIGAGISSAVSRVTKSPMLSLGIMTTIGGGLLMLGPTLLNHATDNLTPAYELITWGDYLHRIFKMTFAGIGYITLALGMIFPFLMKLIEKDVRFPGKALGRLLAINTIGAISGSLLCGFVLLPTWGMWGTLQILTAIYIIVGLMLPIGWSRAGIICRVAGVTFLALTFTALNPTDLPVMGSMPNTKAPKILELWEDSDSTVAVIQKANGHRAITINAGYSLGSTAAYFEQANQANIPLYLFPETSNICFIGIGTGMSAGAAFDDSFPNVKQVVSCELSPAVVKASKKWIPAEFTGGLFSDPRSTILTEDGRHYLMTTDKKFDMINADLFLPYRRGTGSLYSLDYYEIVADRLTPDGAFIQWLPLYQLTEYEYHVIVRTMLEVFDELTMWHNNFSPGQEKVALIGRLKRQPMPIVPLENKETMRSAVTGMQWQQTSPDMVRVEAESMPFFYAGNLRAAEQLFEGYPINTDNKPVIEYETPKTFRQVAQNEKVIWCVGPKLTSIIDQVFAACPIEQDPSWAGHPESTKHLIQAGAAFHQSMVHKALNEPLKADTQWQVFKHQWRQAAQ